MVPVVYFLTVRRLRPILLLLALIVAQAHACQSLFVHPNGEVCVSCPGVACNAEDVDCAKQPVDVTCCTAVQADDHPEQSKAGPNAQPQLGPCVLPAPFELSVEALTIQCRPQFLWLNEHWPNAPPSDRGSRSPPFRLS